jgi:hypothetical protein
MASFFMLGTVTAPTVHKDDYVIPGQITTSDHWFFFSHGNLCF